jgi:hypothetical protein
VSAVRSASRRICVVLDIEKFSGRGNVSQLAMQRTLLEIAVRAVGHARLYWRDIEVEEKGDGLLLQLPADIDEPRVLPALVTGHCLAARAANLVAPATRRIRLRMALTQGIRHVGATGRVGDAVIAACRLVDCRELRAAFAAHPDRDLGLIVADDLYRDVIAHGYPGLDPAAFTEVKIRIPEKGFEQTAWTCVPDPVTGEPLPPPRDFRAARAAATATGIAGAGALAGGLIESAVHHHADAHPAPSPPSPGAALETSHELSAPILESYESPEIYEIHEPDPLPEDPWSGHGYHQDTTGPEYDGGQFDPPHGY